MKKIKVLFDVEILLDIVFTAKTGAGIYYASNAIYQELAKNETIDLTLYSSNRHFGKLQYALDRKLIIPQSKVIKLNKIGSIIARLEYFRFKNASKYGKKIFARAVRFFIKACLQRPLQKFETLFHLYKKEVNSFDIYFSPVYKIPNHLEKETKIKKHILLHDTIPLVMPDIYSFLLTKKSWYRQLIDQINHNDYYFAVSEHTKQDFIKFAPSIDEMKITTVSLAADKKFYPCSGRDIEIREKYNIPQGKKYFLSLCTIEPRKNIFFAVNNFMKFINRHGIRDLVFVVAGGNWKNFSNSILANISTIEGIEESLFPTGYIDSCDLAALYSNAECFVYLSLYEGFGLPPLEAMQCGTPVITSNVSSLPEVVGNAGLMVNPKNDEELIQAYERMYFDKNLKKELSSNGLNRATQFSWEKCANQIVQTFYKSLKEE